MKREAYDKVQKFLQDHDGATMKEAFRATKVSPGTYYNQAARLGGEKQLATSSKRGRKPTYEMVTVESTAYQATSPAAVRPGMVGIIGAPEDVARMIASLARGGA